MQNTIRYDLRCHHHLPALLFALSRINNLTVERNKVEWSSEPLPRLRDALISISLGCLKQISGVFSHLMYWQAHALTAFYWMQSQYPNWSTTLTHRALTTGLNCFHNEGECFPRFRDGSEVKFTTESFEDASFRVSTMLDGVGQWIMRFYVLSMNMYCSVIILL